MGSIDKFIFRTTLASFALVLVSLTGVIWIRQALRGIDLMTSQGLRMAGFVCSAINRSSAQLARLFGRPAIG